jgi:hypothetical protein
MIILKTHSSQCFVHWDHFAHIFDNKLTRFNVRTRFYTPPFLTRLKIYKECQLYTWKWCRCLNNLWECSILFIKRERTNERTNEHERERGRSIFFVGIVGSCICLHKDNNQEYIQCSAFCILNLVNWSKRRNHIWMKTKRFNLLTQSFVQPTSTSLPFPTGFGTQLHTGISSSDSLRGFRFT